MTTHESNAAPSRRAARSGDEQDARVRTMLQDLAPQLDVEPDPEYRRAARQRLVAMATVRTPEPARPSALRRLLTARAVDAPAGRWRTRATAGLAGAALSVTSLATLVALAAGAGPGDVLYGVKRGTEQTQLALAGDSRGQALLDLARTRLEELDDLDGDTGLVRSTLATMDDQTTEGASWYLRRAVDTSDPASLDTLSRWAGDQSAQLVRADVPAGATDDVAGSLVLLDDITARAEGLRTALDCPEGPALDGTDGLGPVPGECRPEVPTPPGPVAPVEPAPGAPTPGGTAPQADPGTPTEPSAPTSGQPGPALPLPSSTVPPPAPSPGGDPALPAPLPDLPLPEVAVPSLPVPAPPATGPSTSPAPPPPAQVPGDVLPLCVAIPSVIQAGDC